MNHAKRLVIMIVMGLVIVSAVIAEEYKVVVPQLSPVTIKVYSDIAQAVIEATGNTATIQVLPFARCIYMMETRRRTLNP